MKKKVTRSTVEKILRKFLTDSNIASIKSYSQGHINTMYEVKLKESNKSLMLRLFNEPWKAKKESFVYKCIRSQLNIPVPEVYAIDDSMTILPNAYALMSKLEGVAIDKNYKKYGNKKLFEKAGEVLAKLHSIKFRKYGWIIDNGIKPSFSKWSDFFKYDLKVKFTKACNVKAVHKLSPGIMEFIDDNIHLLNVRNKPCLLHKDYHCSHILTDKENITGIIDVEWALAGHNENDFMKLELWAFKKMKAAKNSFFKGYIKYGNISKDYSERMNLYELWHLINMVSISYEIKDRRYLKYNVKEIAKFLKK